MDSLINFFSNTQSTGAIDILVNIVLASVFSYVIYLVYIKFGNALSNRRLFGYSFLLITVCTALIISLIKSSIALSLGLVGALSIVRFRTAIKEPEELTYLFLCIAIGLGYGANQRLITTAAGILIVAILIIRGIASKKKDMEDYNLNVTSKLLDLTRVTGILNPHCKELNLRRLDKRGDVMDMLLKVTFKEKESLQLCLDGLSAADEDVMFSFLEQRG
ncbi:MAG: DUF4956 domain-containing protein [Vallitaleaceae bacterium]|nr:DUF4956 domain-containing protein [Vallitaleaceae bacterium]